MLERCFFLFKLAIIRCIQVRISQRHVHASVLEQPKVLGEARVSPLQLDIRTKPKTFLPAHHAWRCAGYSAQHILCL